MKRTAVSISLLIALLAGSNILAPAAIAMTEPDLSSANQAVTPDQIEGHCAACKKLGTILVGPSASGEALRILSTAYTLRSLRGNECRHCLGVVVGRADLFNPSIVERLRAAYGAGHGVGLTNATQAGIQRLHDALGHLGSVQPVAGVASADLIAFRKAFRADGELHSSSLILLPRTAAAAEVGESSRGEKHRQQRQRAADAIDIKALQRIFSAKPVVPGDPPGDNQQNLVSLAESYESHGIQTDSNGDQIQLINLVWSARSFLNSSDFYYVNQEVDYSVSTGPGTLISWSNSATTNLPYQNVTLLQPSPQTTMEATQITSGVSNSIGTSVGFNTAMGLNASVTATTTISNSNTTTVPALSVTNGADFSNATPQWSYDVNDLSAVGAIDLFNNWIWQVPFSSYSDGVQGQLFVNYGASLNANISHGGPANLILSFSSPVPWPFGETFQIQPPVVTGASPACVDSGNSFAIHGTGLYPSLIQAVLINGTPVPSQAITTISDTQLNVIAPDTIQCHFGCPVAVQTNEGTSNTDVNIEISSFCGG